MERGEAELEDGPVYPSQSTDDINSISLLSIFLEGVLQKLSKGERFGSNRYEFYLL